LETATVNASSAISIMNSTRKTAVTSSPFFGLLDVQVTVAVIRDSASILQSIALKTALLLSVQTLSALFSVSPEVLDEGFAAISGSNSSAPLPLVG